MSVASKLIYKSNAETTKIQAWSFRDHLPEFYSKMFPIEQTCKNIWEAFEILE